MLSELNDISSGCGLGWLGSLAAVKKSKEEKKHARAEKKEEKAIARAEKRLEGKKSDKIEDLVASRLPEIQAQCARYQGSFSQPAPGVVVCTLPNGRTLTYNLTGSNWKNPIIKDPIEPKPMDRPGSIPLTRAEKREEKKEARAEKKAERQAEKIGDRQQWVQDRCKGDFSITQTGNGATCLYPDDRKELYSLTSKNWKKPTVVDLKAKDLPDPVKPGKSKTPRSESGKKLTKTRVKKWDARCSQVGGTLDPNGNCTVNGVVFEPTLKLFNQYAKCNKKTGVFDFSTGSCKLPVSPGTVAPPVLPPGTSIPIDNSSQNTPIFGGVWENAFKTECEKRGGRFQATNNKANHNVKCNGAVMKDWRRSNPWPYVTIAPPGGPNVMPTPSPTPSPDSGIPFGDDTPPPPGGTGTSGGGSTGGGSFPGGGSGYAPGGGGGVIDFPEGQSPGGDSAMDFGPGGECSLQFDGVNPIQYKDCYGMMDVVRVVCGPGSSPGSTAAAQVSFSGPAKSSSDFMDQSF